MFRFRPGLDRLSSLALSRRNSPRPLAAGMIDNRPARAARSDRSGGEGGADGYTLVMGSWPARGEPGDLQEPPYDP